jgi:hypothetical protein
MGTPGPLPPPGAGSGHHPAVAERGPDLGLVEIAQGHWFAEEAPEGTLAELTPFLAPYRP